MAVKDMKKFSAITDAENTKHLLRELQRLRCVRLEHHLYENEEDRLPDFVLPEGMSEVAQLREHENSRELAEITSLVSSCTAALSFLGDYHTAREPMFAAPPEITSEEFEEKYLTSAKHSMDMALEVRNRLAKLQKDRQSKSNRISVCRPFESAEVSLPVSHTKHTSTVCGMVPFAVTDESIGEALKDTASVFDVLFEDKTTGKAVMLTSVKEELDLAISCIAPLGFVKTSAVCAEEEGFARGVIKESEASLEKIGAQIESLNAQAEKLSNEKIKEIRMYLDYLTTAETRIRESSKVCETERCSVIVGWLPDSSCKKVAELFDRTDTAYSFDEPEPEKESVPIKLSNGKMGTQFEPIVSLYALPAYGAYDPTGLMSIFYILIFGLMFADFGYGFTLILGCVLGLKFLHPNEGLKKFLRMFAMCGVASMVGGVLFGGYFGDMPTRIMEDLLGMEKAPNMALCFNMTDNPMAFLIVSLGMGAVHIFTGMMIKFVLLIRKGEVFSAIFDVGSWFVVFAGIGLYTVYPKVGIWIALAGALMLILTQGREAKNPVMRILKGILSLYDLISYGSDLLSYSRILALSLASAVIANVVNIFGTMGGPGIGGVISMTVAFLIGHTLNFAVNLLGTYVHTSRLQYIEYFGKFYESGGREFIPLTPETKYTIFK